MTTKENIYKLELFPIEIYPFDLEGGFTWEQATIACSKLGKNWRLPTKEELNLIYEYRNEIGGFANVSYWSSTDFDDYFAWAQNFSNGYQNYFNKSNSFYVRAVRDIV